MLDRQKSAATREREREDDGEEDVGKQELPPALATLQANATPAK